MNKFILITFCLFCLFSNQPSIAKPKHAHKTDYYRLFDDGGEHPAETCAVVKKLPSKLKKTLKSAKGYLGTEQIEFADQNEAAIDAYQHYFSTEQACKQALKAQ